MSSIVPFTWCIRGIFGVVLLRRPVTYMASCPPVVSEPLMEMLIGSISFETQSPSCPPPPHLHRLTSNLVDVLQGQAKGLVSGARRRLDGVQSLQQRGACGISIFPVHPPALEPGRLWRSYTVHFDVTGLSRSNLTLKLPFLFIDPSVVC